MSFPVSSILFLKGKPPIYLDLERRVSEGNICYCVVVVHSWSLQKLINLEWEGSLTDVGLAVGTRRPSLWLPPSYTRGRGQNHEGLTPQSGQKPSNVPTNIIFNIFSFSFFLFWNLTDFLTLHISLSSYFSFGLLIFYEIGILIITCVIT